VPLPSHSRVHCCAKHQMLDSALLPVPPLQQDLMERGMEEVQVLAPGVAILALQAL
jgi:hypothetical protein